MIFIASLSQILTCEKVLILKTIHLLFIRKTSNTIIRTKIRIFCQAITFLSRKFFTAKKNLEEQIKGTKNTFYNKDKFYSNYKNSYELLQKTQEKVIS